MGNSLRFTLWQGYKAPVAGRIAVGQHGQLFGLAGQAGIALQREGQGQHAVLLLSGEQIDLIPAQVTGSTGGTPGYSQLP